MKRDEERQGKCHKCGVRFVWPHPFAWTNLLALDEGFCPRCGTKLERTSYQSRLRVERITRPLRAGEARRIFASAVLLFLALAAGVEAGETRRGSWMRLLRVLSLAGDEARLRSDAMGLAPTTPTVVRFAHEEFDDSDLHTADRPECLVIRSPGRYEIGASVQWGLNEYGSRDLMLWKKPDGGYRQMLERDLVFPCQDIVTTQSVVTFAELAAGDCVFVMISHSGKAGISALATLWIRQ